MRSLNEGMPRASKLRLQLVFNLSSNPSRDDTSVRLAIRNEINRGDVDLEITALLALDVPPMKASGTRIDSRARPAADGAVVHPHPLNRFCFKRHATLLTARLPSIEANAAERRRWRELAL